jgi:hypothetical protein
VPTAAAGAVRRGCVWMVGYQRPRCPRPAQGLRPCLWRTAAVRPAPGHTPSRAADTAAVSGCVDTCWVARLVCAAGGHPWSGRSDSGRGRWTAAAAGARRCGHPRRRQRRADPAATQRWTAGSTAVHRHRRCPTRNGTARCGIGQYPSCLTARSVAWCSASIWSPPRAPSFCGMSGSLKGDPQSEQGGGVVAWWRSAAG